jgi:DNA-binding PadR family transcriptional regulator
MRHKVRRELDEFENRREGGRDSESRGMADPASKRHRAHGHRGRRDPDGPPRRGRWRAQQGDVRTAILLVVADEPMHGYQIMQAMSNRTDGAWRPNPGAVYPTIAQLEDEGLVTTRDDGERRLVTLTSEGRAYLEERSSGLGDPFTAFAAGPPTGPDLRDPLHELQVVVRQIAGGANAVQVEAAAQVLAKARRSLYLILAREAEASE